MPRKGKLDEAFEEEAIERYEGGESLESIANDFGRRGVRGPRLSIDRVLEENRIIRHAGPGEMPERSPQGFCDSVYWLPKRREGEGHAARRERILRSISHQEVAVRYRDKGESLATIMYELRMRGTEVSTHYLRIILEGQGVTLRGGH